MSVEMSDCSTYVFRIVLREKLLIDVVNNMTCICPQPSQSVIILVVVSHVDSHTHTVDHRCTCIPTVMITVIAKLLIDGMAATGWLEMRHCGTLDREVRRSVDYCGVC